MPDYTAEPEDSVETLTQLLKAYDQTSMEMSERLKKDMRDIMDNRAGERASLVERISQAARRRSTVISMPDFPRRMTIDTTEGRVLDLNISDNATVLALLEQVLKSRNALPQGGLQITLIANSAPPFVSTLGGPVQARTRSIDLDSMEQSGPQPGIAEQYSEARAMPYETEGPSRAQRKR